MRKGRWMLVTKEQRLAIKCHAELLDICRIVAQHGEKFQKEGNKLSASGRKIYAKALASLAKAEGVKP